MRRLIFSALLLLPIAAFATGEVEEGPLQWWTFPRFGDNPASGDFEQAAIDAYGGGIDVTVLNWEGGVDKLQTALAAGAGPDMVYDFLGRSGGWYYTGAAVPMQDYVSADIQDAIAPAFRDLYVIDGDLHAVPMMGWTRGLIVNEHLVAEAGLEHLLPEVGEEWDLDEFTQFVTEFDVPGAYPYGMGFASHQGEYAWWQLIWTIGDAVEAIEYMQAIEPYCVPGSATHTVTDIRTMFLRGEVALTDGNRSDHVELQQSSREGVIDYEPTTRLINYPDGGAGERSVLGPTGFVTFSRPQDTAPFIEFFLRTYADAAVNESGQIPALDFIDIDMSDPHMSAAFGLAQYPAGDFYMSRERYGDIRVEFVQTLQSVFGLGTPPEEAWAEFEERIEELM